MALRRVARIGMTLLVAASLATATACGDGKKNGDDKSSGSTPVSLDFWGWAPGYDKSVALWNQTHPNIKVNFSKVPSGASGGYAKMRFA